MQENVSSNVVLDSLYGVSLSRGGLVLASSYLRNSNDNYIVANGKKFIHRLPASKVMWCGEGIFASTSTSLRIWRASLDKPMYKLASSKSAGQAITSFDWQGARIATCSIDTTIVIWNIERGKMETRMIAHDKAVFDVSFAPNPNLFASVSDDGSLRMFDMRDLDHSTIVYEGSAPMLRLAWNMQSNSIATIGSDSKTICLFDMRKVGFGLKTVSTNACPNAISWSNDHGLISGLADGSIVVINNTAMQSKKIASFPQPCVNIAVENNSVAAVHGSAVSVISAAN